MKPILESLQLKELLPINPRSSSQIWPGFRFKLHQITQQVCAEFFFSSFTIAIDMHLFFDYCLYFSTQTISCNPMKQIEWFISNWVIYLGIWCSTRAIPILISYKKDPSSCILPGLFHRILMQSGFWRNKIRSDLSLSESSQLVSSLLESPESKSSLHCKCLQANDR